MLCFWWRVAWKQELDRVYPDSKRKSAELLTYSFYFGDSKRMIGNVGRFYAQRCLLDCIYITQNV